MEPPEDNGLLGKDLDIPEGDWVVEKEVIAEGVAVTMEVPGGSGLYGRGWNNPDDEKGAWIEEIKLNGAMVRVLRIGQRPPPPKEVGTSAKTSSPVTATDCDEPATSAILNTIDDPHALTSQPNHLAQLHAPEFQRYEIKVESDYSNFFTTLVRCACAQKLAKKQLLRHSVIVINAGPYREYSFKWESKNSTLDLDFYSYLRCLPDARPRSRNVLGKEGEEYLLSIL